MFFRRAKIHVATFDELIGNLKPYGMNVQNEAGGRVRVDRNGIGAVIHDVPGGQRPHVEKAGLVMGTETGVLVNGGYQQFWLTPTKKRAPAQAAQLKELHAFEEDLKEGLGISSLYNTSLGTTSSLHLYDRLEERDAPVHHAKPWEKPQPGVMNR